MHLDMIIPEEPEKFKELCEKVGLALMMGQKVQFALAHYYSIYQIVNNGWDKGKAKEKIMFHLSKPMGVVVSSIEKNAPLNDELFRKVIDFKNLRNWLVHDFDEESTPFLSQDQKFDYYIEKMENIAHQANQVMVVLHEIGQNLVPVSI